MWFCSLFSLLLLAVSRVSAQAGFCQSSLNLCLVLSIPEASASAGSGKIVFNVTAPASGWSGVGLGSEMEGSLVFMVWPSGNNIVVSPRIATGESQPTYWEEAGVELLDGSGVSGDTMKAVFSCSNCWNWGSGSLQASSTRRPWIYAQNLNNNVRSSNPDANLEYHNERGTTSVDMTRAVTSSDGTSRGSPDITADGSLDIGLTRSQKVLIAHAVLMGVSFLILFPMGISIIRFFAKFVPSPVWAHAGFQIFTWILVIIGFGMGVWLSNMMDEHFKYAHQTFGAVIVWLFVLQIAFGLWHHSYFKSHRQRGIPSHLHLWFGRALILCGIINGGLGLDISSAPRPWIIAYAVIAAVVGISLIVGVGMKEFSRSRNQRIVKNNDN